MNGSSGQMVCNMMVRKRAIKLGLCRNTYFGPINRVQSWYIFSMFVAAHLLLCQMADQFVNYFICMDDEFVSEIRLMFDKIKILFDLLGRKLIDCLYLCKNFSQPKKKKIQNETERKKNAD